mgnify:CR=1 FL=1
MTDSQLDKRKTWGTLGLFCTFLILFTSLAHYVLIKLNPTSLYIGGLMISPALATILTLKIKGRPLSSLPWSLKNWKYMSLGYLTPMLYVSVSYALIWIFGLGDIFNTETLKEWSSELGLDGSSSTLVLITMVVLLAVIGVLKNLGSVFGEELGWRGFFIFELRKVMSFQRVAIVSGLVWSVFHWPIIIYYGGDDPVFQIAAFTVMIVAMSVIMAYFTFKSNSLWPAVIFHSVHNIYIQKIFTPLTIETENTALWIDEYGVMIPIVSSVIAIYYWRKAKQENL